MNEFNNVQMKENQDPIVSDWDLHKFLQDIHNGLKEEGNWLLREIDRTLSIKRFGWL